MTTADCIESLHHTMCSTFNADNVTKTTEENSLIKHDLDDYKTFIQTAKTISDATDCTVEQMKKSFKYEDVQVATEATMELLLSSMSSTFDAECATSTDEAGSLLNHDLAEDKTIKWRNLVNNKFAYKENTIYRRVRRVRKQTYGIQQSSSYISNNGKTTHNDKQKKQEQRSGRREKRLNEQNKSVVKKSTKALTESTLHREVCTPTAEYIEKQIKTLLSDDEDLQQFNEYDTANEFIKSEMTICKEELIVGDDETLLLAPDINELSAGRNRRSIYHNNSNSCHETKRMWQQVGVEGSDGKQQAVIAIPEAALIPPNAADIVPIKLETIKQDTGIIDGYLVATDAKDEQHELTFEDALTTLTGGSAKNYSLCNGNRSNSDLSNRKESKTRKFKQEATTRIHKEKANKRVVANKNKRKKKIRK